MTIDLTQAEAARFWTKVRKSTPSSCWPWSTDTNNKGYGRFTIWRGTRRRRFLAHRVAYQLTNATPIEGLVLLHSCDTPACCNPSHLRPGTQADNVADAHAKGRMVPPPRLCGEAAPTARLTYAKATEIRRRYAAGDVTQRALAVEFGVTQAAISAVVRGRTWTAS